MESVASTVARVRNVQDSSLLNTWIGLHHLSSACQRAPFRVGSLFKSNDRELVGQQKESTVMVGVGIVTEIHHSCTVIAPYLWFCLSQFQLPRANCSSEADDSLTDWII